MALTADRIEKDLKKILNITSSGNVDLDKSNEAERLPNGFHAIGALAAKSEAAVNNSSERVAQNDDQRDQKDTRNKRRNKKQDFHKPISFSYGNGRNSNSGSDLARACRNDNIPNGFRGDDYSRNVDMPNEASEDLTVMERSRSNKKGSEIWKKKRQKKVFNNSVNSDFVDGNLNQIAGDAVGNDGFSEKLKPSGATKRTSKEKPLKVQSSPKTDGDANCNAEHQATQDDEETLQGPNGMEDLENMATGLLTCVYEENKISEEALAKRRGAFEELRVIIKSTIPDASTRIYGSTESGVATKSSDVNVDIATKQPKDDFKLLKAAFEVDREHFGRVDLQNVNNSLILSADWRREGEATFTFTLKANVENSTQTSRLLGAYTSMDDRVAVLATCLRIWAKKFHLDRQDEGSLPPHSFHLMVVFYLQKIQILPVLHEMYQEEEGGDVKKSQNVDPAFLEALAKGWTANDSKGVGLLWIKMLKYYNFFSFERTALNVRRSTIVYRSSLGWGSKNMAIEDPYCTRRNLARSLCHTSIYHFFKKHLACMLQSFSSSESTRADLWTSYFSPEDSLVLPPKMCTTCQSIGHIKKSCPEETVEPLPPLPTPNEWVFQFIDSLLEDVLAAYEQGPEEYRIKERVKDDIEQLIRSIFPEKDPILTLFGSSCNGFGFRKSDLDLSLSFKGQESLEMASCIQVINELADGLVKDRRFREVVAITTAKVPIVKFCLGDFECDICLYNTLAQHNTRLLARYADLDRRARLLGYGIKHLAKVCHICDASKGSLSSYAYTLMAIYFLQRTTPPVLPVLQELTDKKGSGEDRPTVMVEGWDVWFDDSVGGRWKSENRQSAGRLWLEMIEFYSGYFDYENDVVCIRQTGRLQKEEKNWTGPGISIEDPFNLDHNLGARLTNRMSIYIRKAFQRATILFATEAVVREASMSRHAKYILFNKSKLTDGPPPNDRGCRKCFKLGHFIADCPKLQKKKPKPVANESDGQKTGRESTKAEENVPSTLDQVQPRNGDLVRPQMQHIQLHNNKIYSDKKQQQQQPHHHHHQQQQQQQHMQLRMHAVPPGLALLQSPQKQPLLQMPANVVPMMPACSEAQVSFYPAGGVGFLVPPFRQFARVQQAASAPGVSQMRLPQTIPSMNTVFKRSDFSRPPSESQHRPHHNHLPPSNQHHHHHHQQQHPPPPPHLQHHQQQQQQQQQQPHHVGSNASKVHFPPQ